MTAGAFVRQQSRFRGRPHGGPERHHLYVALACPWSQRAVIVRAVLGLEDDSASPTLDPYRDERGWAFTGGRFTDEVNGFEFLSRGLRGDASPATTAASRCPSCGTRRTSGSSPTSRPTSSASSTSGPAATSTRRTSAPRSTSSTSWIYDELQNGVYRAGFARSQEAYDEAYRGVFAALAAAGGASWPTAAT